MIKRYDLFQIHLCGQQPRGELQEALEGEYVAFDDVAHLLAPLSSQDDVVNRVAKALASVDLSRSVNLTRLVDGVSEYTLTYGDGSEPLVFDDINDAYEHVRNRTRHAQAAAVTAALAPAPSDRPSLHTFESAPKDGTWFIAYRGPAACGTWDRYVIVRWHEEFDDFVWPDEPFDILADDLDEKREDGRFKQSPYEACGSFTHWSPLPVVSDASQAPVARMDGDA